MAVYAIAVLLALLPSTAPAAGVGSRPVTRHVEVSGHARLRLSVEAPRCAASLTVRVDGHGAATGRVAHRRTLTADRLLRPGRHTVRLRTTQGGCPLNVRLALDPVWVPAPDTTWQWQLTGRVDLSIPAAMYDVDLVDTTASTVAAIHAQGAHAVCYLSAGSLERGRPDVAAFPVVVAGKTLDGWPDERWLDIRRLRAIGPPLERRLDRCAAKGFDAVEADNVDGYANDTGFPLTGADQLRFNRFLAREAHARGLSIGLKNDVGQTEALEPDFDWALDEECFRYDECGRLAPFARAGKAVFVTEYDRDPSTFCAQAAASHFMAMRKRLALDAWRQPCW